MKDWHTRVVTLSETKGLSERFFAALRRARFGVWSVTCTNVLRSDLAHSLAGSLIRVGFLSKPQLARISRREEPRVRHARAGGHPGASPLNDCVFPLDSRIRGNDVSSFLSVKAYP